MWCYCISSVLWQWLEVILVPNCLNFLFYLFTYFHFLWRDYMRLDNSFVVCHVKIPFATLRLLVHTITCSSSSISIPFCKRQEKRRQIAYKYKSPHRQQSLCLLTILTLCPVHPRKHGLQTVTTDILHTLFPDNIYLWRHALISTTAWETTRHHLRPTHYPVPLPCVACGLLGISGETWASIPRDPHGINSAGHAIGY